MICLFIFSISSWFGLRRLYLSEKLHFFYVVHFIYIQFLVIVSWDPLYLCGVSCDFSFLFLILLIWVLYFLLDEKKKVFFNFVYLLKESSFSFIALCYCFLCLYYSILHIIFYLHGTFCWTVILLLLHLS